jgi:hypothetical protein
MAVPEVITLLLRNSTSTVRSLPSQGIILPQGPWQFELANNPFKPLTDEPEDNEQE